MDSLNNSRASAARLFTAAVNKQPAPNTKLQRSFKFQVSMRAGGRVLPLWLVIRGSWDLKLGVSLGLGAWDLELAMIFNNP